MSHLKADMPLNSEPDALRLLLIEDSEDDALLLLRHLQHAGYRIQYQRVFSEESLHAALSAASWDLVISDFSMPQFNGMAALRIVRTMDANLPVIVLSGAIGEERAVDVMKAGASDYVRKDNMTRLVPAIARELRDAAERKRLETQVRRYTEMLEQMVEERTRELNRAKEQLEVILSNSSDGIVLALASGDIQSANPAFRELFGERVRDSVEEIIHLLASQTEMEDISGALASVVYENRNTRTQATIMRQDGRQIDIDLAFTPVELEGTERPGFILSVRDITALRDIERFKAQFVANAAHDLSNPVATLKTQLYLLKARPERLDQHLEVIEKQTSRLENLISELRTLSEIDRGLVSLELEALDLNHLIGGVVEEHLALAEAHAHRLRFEPTNPLPAVQLDRHKFVRIVANLIANAIDYTPNGGEIIVRTFCDPTEAGFSVRDTGIGIVDKDLEQVFERFYRSDQAKSLRSEGTGLGLAIVREMVEAHGGTISVTSIPEHGSEFTIRLPLTGWQ